MNRIFTYITVITVISLCNACTVMDTYQNDGNIRLSVAIDGVDVSTRAAQYAEPYEGSVPTPSNPLEAAVWFSTIPGVYEHDPASPTWLPCHTTIRYESSVPKDPDPWQGNNLKYPTSNDPVYCVGMVPKTGWSVSGDGKTATYDNLDGFTDVLFARQITGKWSEHFGAQVYEHVLTWIKVSVVAMDLNAPVFWGDLKRISIESGSKVDITLFDQTEGKSLISYSGNAEHVVFDDSMELNTQINEVGSVLCTPALSYDINVTTEKETKTINVVLLDEYGNPLTSVEDAVGKQFIIELYFHPFSVIEGDCTLQSWEYKDDNIYLK